MKPIDHYLSRLKFENIDGGTEKKEVDYIKTNRGVFRLGKLLGEGTFAVVREVIDVDEKY